MAIAKTFGGDRASFDLDTDQPHVSKTAPSGDEPVASIGADWISVAHSYPECDYLASPRHGAGKWDYSIIVAVMDAAGQQQGYYRYHYPTEQWVDAERLTPAFSAAGTYWQ